MARYRKTETDATILSVNEENYQSNDEVLQRLPSVSEDDDALLIWLFMLRKWTGCEKKYSCSSRESPRVDS